MKKQIYIGLITLVSSATAMAQSNSNTYLFVGSYTDNNNAGVTVFDFDEKTGSTNKLCDIKSIKNASFLTFSEDNEKVYCVREEDEKQSGVYTLSFDHKNKMLTELNFEPSKGAAPCYIAIDPKERFVATANYNGGNISIFPLNKKGIIEPVSQVINFTGSSIDKERQGESHLHCIAFAPNGKYIYATDLGTDKIYRFEITNKRSRPFIAEETKKQIAVNAGSGPRHLTFHPNGKHAYLINEISGNVIVFNYNDGDLNPSQYIAADSVGAKGSADIHVSPDGKFLYASNRLKADGIAIFKINKQGTLTKIGYQNTATHPRNFVISKSGMFILVASKDQDLIQIFKINKETGLLDDTEQIINVENPVCLQFM